MITFTTPGYQWFASPQIGSAAAVERVHAYWRRLVQTVQCPLSEKVHHAVSLLSKRLRGVVEIACQAGVEEV